MGHTATMPEAYLRQALSGSAEHHAVLAELCGHHSRVIALGSAVKGSGDSYELGVLVEDEFQGCGVGTALCDHLVGALPKRCTLIADALFDNRRVLHLLSRYGSLRLTHSLGDVTAIVNVCRP